MCRALSQPEVRKEHYGATRIKPREGEKWKQWKECYKWCIFDKKQAWTNLLNMRLQKNNWCRRIWCVQFCTTDAGLEMQAYNCRFRCFNKRTFLVILQLMSLRQFLISATLLRSQGGRISACHLHSNEGRHCETDLAEKRQNKSDSCSKPQVMLEVEDEWLQKLKPSQRCKHNLFRFVFGIPINVLKRSITINSDNVEAFSNNTAFSPLSAAGQRLWYHHLRQTTFNSSERS